MRRSAINRVERERGPRADGAGDQLVGRQEPHRGGGVTPPRPPRGARGPLACWGVARTRRGGGLSRVSARRGVRVAPFKAQNMSNNAAVCADGSEIGRAQALQAAAAGVEPTADMNPVLLKPEADARSQVIVLGRPWRTLRAGSYYRRRDELWPVVTAALERLRAGCDLVIIEGAGSPVELNLRSLDIVNMAIARHARAPVLLVGDIDRGGIF